MRIHQHVNPLNKRYLTLPSIPDWTEVYANPFNPLHLDLGCAAGHFLIKMAQEHKDWNFLGLEIRQALVERANRWKSEKGLNNLFFFTGQADIVLKPLAESLPINVLQYVSINFPDPWFKRRHHKRRIINTELVNTLAAYLQPNGKVFIQTDVEELLPEVKSLFLAHSHFSLVQELMENNPFSIITEREASVLRLGRKVYRVLFQINKKVNTASQTN